MSYLKSLYDKGLVKPPKWMLANIHYETVTGSESYGVSSGDSDKDIVGFCIPHQEVLFPHLAGEVQGFGRHIQRFEQYQQHHIIDKSADKEYDFTIYNIAKYFQLLMENNPNVIETLFTPRTCVLHSTPISEMVRMNRKMFLHKGSFFKYKGYAYSQVAKIRTKTPDPDTKRAKLVEQFGYDVKYGLHVVRLLNNIEQILIEEDLDLQRNREQLKSIRRGEWKEQDIYDYFDKKEPELETLYTNSKLQHSPDESKIKQLLLQCLEMHFGSLDKCIVVPGRLESFCKELKELQEKYNI